jgi:hypothetical protein
VRKGSYVMTWLDYMSARVPIDVWRRGREQQMARECVVLHGLLTTDGNEPTQHTYLDLATLSGRRDRGLHELL